MTNVIAAFFVLRLLEEDSMRAYASH